MNKCDLFQKLYKIKATLLSIISSFHTFRYLIMYANVNVFNRNAPNFLSDRHCYLKPSIIYTTFAQSSKGS